MTNGIKSVGRRSIKAAERRTQIQNQLLVRGLVRVAALAEDFGVVENTVREDLVALEREGKLVRVHGGAIPKEGAMPSRPYPETQGAHMHEKALIGEAALAYVPVSGSAYFFGGSTTMELATRLPRNSDLHIYTSALWVATHIATNEISPVEIIGGAIEPKSMVSDMSLSREAIDELYWDCCFLGTPGIGVAFGVTELKRNIAEIIRKVIQHTRQVVVLCDSSKIDRFCHVLVCPIEAIDVLVTDSGIDPHTIEELNAKGVEVAVATEDGKTEVFSARKHPSDS